MTIPYTPDPIRSTFPPRIVARDAVVAVAVPKGMTVETDFLRFREGIGLTPKTTPPSTSAAIAFAGASADPVIAFFAGTAGTLKVYTSTSGTGVIHGLNLFSDPVDMSPVGQTRTLFITSGVGLFTVEAPDVGTSPTPMLPTVPVGLTPPGYNQGGAIYGVFASTPSDVYWGKALYSDAGPATEFAILRTQVAASPANMRECTASSWRT